MNDEEVFHSPVTLLSRFPICVGQHYTDQRGNLVRVESLTELDQVIISFLCGEKWFRAEPIPMTETRDWVPVETNAPSVRTIHAQLSPRAMTEIQQAMVTNPPQFNLGQLVSVDIWIEGCLERLNGVVTGLNYSYFPRTKTRAWEYSVVPDGDTIEDIFQEEQVHPAAEVTA